MINNISKHLYINNNSYKKTLIFNSLRYFSSSKKDDNASPSAVIVGGTKGVGLSIANHWYNTYGHIDDAKLFICGRSKPIDNPIYKNLIDKDNVYNIKLDLLQEDSIHDASKNILKYTKTIDYLINTAGFLHSYDPDTLKPSKTFPNLPERTFRVLTLEGMQHTFGINTFGPALLITAFYKALTHSSRKSYRKLIENKPPIVAAITARVASITENESGGWTSYRASKSALNMILKNAHFEFRKGLGTKEQAVSFIALHPGTVDTDLSKPFQKMAKKKYQIMTSDESGNKLFHLLKNSDENDSGKFYDYEKKIQLFNGSKVSGWSSGLLKKKKKKKIKSFLFLHFFSY